VENDEDGILLQRAAGYVSSLWSTRSGKWSGVRRAGLAKAEPGADAGPAAPQAPPWSLL